MTILITGGAGYIGSHTVIELVEAGHDIVVLDNFCNSHPKSLERVSEITGKPVILERADIRDGKAVEAILAKYDCDSVIHFAGLKAVGESGELPLKYYDNNVVGTLRVLEAMRNHGVKKMVFSSSATVYGPPQRLPLDEAHSTGAINAYGRTKEMIENILRDFAASDPDFSFAILRYFNPVGAHESGLLGENPLGVPNNLMPLVTQVATGIRSELAVFGDDYDTPDGTGIRDYVHVTDLAKGHLCAHNALTGIGSFTVNLGTGVGHSVLDLVKTFERATNTKIPHRFAPRRDGDVAQCFADTTLANKMLGWRAEKTLTDMCRDTWKWVQTNPNGFGD